MKKSVQYRLGQYQVPGNWYVDVKEQWAETWQMLPESHG